MRISPIIIGVAQEGLKNFFFVEAREDALGLATAVGAGGGSNARRREEFRWRVLWAKRGC